MSELPKGWAKTTLLETVELHDSRRVPLNASQREVMKGEYPYYGANGLVDHVNDFIFDGHYVLLAEDGGNFDKPERGVAYEVQGKFWVNNHAHILTGQGGIPPRFLLHLLNAIDWMPFIGGTTRAKLTQAGMENVRILLPPLAEQWRIVEKLDGILAKTARARKELDRIPSLIIHYKKSILAAAFSGKLTADWRTLHLLESVQTAEISSTCTNRRRKTEKKLADGDFDPPFSLPSTWKWIPLPQLGLLDRGKSRHRPRNDRTLYGGPYPFVQTGDIKAARGHLFTYSQTYNETGLAQSRLWPKGTLCITIAANIAETAILEIDACFPDSIVGFTADQNYCLPTFVEFFFRTVKSDLAAFAPATAQKNINLETLSALYIPTPPIDEQHEVVSRIEAAFAWLDKVAAEHGRAVHLLPKLEQAILTKAFRGDLVPQDPNDEPASELLLHIHSARADAPKQKRGRNLGSKITPRVPKKKAAKNHHDDVKDNAA